MVVVTPNNSQISNNNILTNRSKHLNPDFNTALTRWANTLGRVLTPKERRFLYLSYKIIVLSGRPFTSNEFAPEIKEGYVRLILNNLKPIVKTITKSHRCFYSLDGLYTDQNLTRWYTGVPESSRIFGTLDQLLSLVNHRPAMMHNIRIDTKVSELHEALTASGHKPQPDNKHIIIKLKNNPYIEPLIEPTLTITTKNTLEFAIGCTRNSISYTPSGFAKIFDILGQLKTILHLRSQSNFQIEPVSDMNLRYFHFNRDSLQYSFPPGVTLDIVYRHTHIYHKRLENSKSIIRAEEEIEQNNTISEELLTTRFQKASEMFDDIFL